MAVGFIVTLITGHKDEVIAEVEAVAASAGGSPSEVNINAAIDKIIPPYFRPLVDSALAAEEPKLTAALAQGAPAFIAQVITTLQQLQTKLAG